MAYIPRNDNNVRYPEQIHLCTVQQTILSYPMLLAPKKKQGRMFNACATKVKLVSFRKANEKERWQKREEESMH
jgi:hypothetical protein